MGNASFNMDSPRATFAKKQYRAAKQELKNLFKIKTGIEEKKPDAKVIAYDLETTRIQDGTPDLLYITAYGENFNLSQPIIGKDSDARSKILCDILEQNFLTKENNGAMFIAWNGNKFDVYFLALALLNSDRWVLQPYLTASKQLRGIRIKEKRKTKSKKGKILQFQFLDGISMTGMVGTPLKKFLKTFAPNFQKLDLDFETTNFNAKNKDHVKYAERDSEGLYHAMLKVREIIKTLTGNDLKPTIGNLAIRYFMDNLPADSDLKSPNDELKAILHGSVKRGGYCWAARQYHGPVWKYDINQAYAAALRDCALPSGQAIKTQTYVDDLPGIYHIELSREKKTKVPFYYKDDVSAGGFTDGKNKVETWVTSLEIEHLKLDGWKIKILNGYFWSSSFNMKLMVDKLEKLRHSDPEGPGGPLGTMVKAIGNNAYGKTLEQLWGSEFVFAAEQPDGYNPYDVFDRSMSHVYVRQKKDFPKKYHLPQIGVFVTAFVRCFVRAAALKESDAFLYADTDCLVFSKAVHHLDVDTKRYGAWKQEAAGKKYIIIGKKCYLEIGDDGKTYAKAKGLITKNLTEETYHKWLKGELPIQVQIQRQNLLKFLGGAAMFKTLERKGTNVQNSKSCDVIEGYFVPR